MKFAYLSRKFYEHYGQYPEIEKKESRPYVVHLVKIGDLEFAIPMRSHIRHPNAYITDKSSGSGVDYSKAVVILDEEYIDFSKKPIIRSEEFNILKGKDHIIQTQFKKYVKDYMRAYLHPEVSRNRNLCQFSCLQYFHPQLRDISVEIYGVDIFSEYSGYEREDG